MANFYTEARQNMTYVVLIIVSGSQRALGNWNYLGFLETKRIGLLC